MSNPNLNVLAATAFKAEDATDSRFYVFGQLRGGILQFEILAQRADGTRGSVSGTEFFTAMMTHFGDSVKIIEGDWSAHTPDFRSNIDELNRLTRAGLSVADAAALVWTGRRARSLGFSKVNVVRALPPQAQGNYQSVLVRFSK